MLIQAASVSQWSFACIGVIGSVAACVHGSKCRKVSCSLLKGCECERSVPEASDSDVADEPPTHPDNLTIQRGH